LDNKVKEPTFLYFVITIPNLFFKNNITRYQYKIFLFIKYKISERKMLL